MNRIILLCSFTLLWVSASQAIETGRIYFPADKNGAHLLSQKLEFQVINNESIKLGNLLISGDDVRIELSDTSEALPNFSFFGPPQFIKNSTILIRDPTGRAIWSYKINNKNLENVNINNTNLAVLRLKNTEVKMLKNLANTIFFNFCIFYEEENHRYNLCSKDYHIEHNANIWSLSSIASNKKEYIIQVNGIEVGHEGLVQISEKVSTISFSSRLSTGLLVEFRTGNIPIEIIDSKWETKSEYADLVIREKNTNDTFNLKNSWEAKVPFSKSFFYLEGESQIPLKQEIFFDVNPPSEKVRPTLINNIFKTYSDMLVIDLKKATDTNIKPKTKGDSVTNRDTLSIWNIKNIKLDGSNTHYIEITNQDKKYFASYEVLRGLPWVTKLNLKTTEFTQSTSKSSSNNITGTGNGFEFNLIYHATSFLGLNSDWCQLKWFTELTTQTINNKPKNGEINSLQENNLDFGYRFNYGFHHETPSLGFTIGLLNRKTDSDSASSPTFGLFYKNPIVDIPGFGKTFYTDIKMAPSLTYAKSELTGTNMRLKVESQYSYNKKFFWFWDLIAASESLKNEVIDFPIKTQTNELSIGFGGVF